jgi:hypothetical protein
VINGTEGADNLDELGPGIGNQHGVDKIDVTAIDA